MVCEVLTMLVIFISAENLILVTIVGYRRIFSHAPGIDQILQHTLGMFGYRYWIKYTRLESDCFCWPLRPRLCLKRGSRKIPLGKTLGLSSSCSPLQQPFGGSTVRRCGRRPGTSPVACRSSTSNRHNLTATNISIAACHLFLACRRMSYNKYTCCKHTTHKHIYINNNQEKNRNSIVLNQVLQWLLHTFTL